MNGRGYVVVTGASTGIGRETALLLAASGFKVFGTVRREPDGEPLKASESGQVTPVLMDVTRPETIAAAFARITEEVGSAGLAGLVNNAGIASGGPLEFLALADLRHQFEVNVFGLLGVTQAALPLLRSGRGRIVNIGSNSGLAVSPFLAPYCASKYAVEALNDGLRMELAPFGIKVSLVEPGRIVTPIWDRGLAEGQRVRAALPPQALTFYGAYLDRLEGMITKAKREGIHPRHVARVVLHALTAGRPRTRYLVGWDARIQLTAKKLLPTRWFDALMMFLLKRGWM